jgi:hypothetical protein
VTATPTAAPTLIATGTPTATPGGRATPSPRPRPTLAGRLGEQAARSLHKPAELPHKLDVTQVPAIKVIFITGQYRASFLCRLHSFSPSPLSASCIEVGPRARSRWFRRNQRRFQRTGDRVFKLLHSDRAETKQKARQARVGPAKIIAPSGREAKL